MAMAMSNGLNDVLDHLLALEESTTFLLKVTISKIVVKTDRPG
jgi:hypothetical protein